MESRWWYICYIRYQGWSWSMATSKEALIQTLESIITELEQEGSVDKYFRMSEQLKDVNGPYFFVNLLPTFINDTRNSLRELAGLLEQVPVNFHAIDQVAIKLKGSTSCLGACRMARACANLRHATQSGNQQGCIQAMNEIKNEFERIHARLDVIVQLERQIISL